MQTKDIDGNLLSTSIRIDGVNMERLTAISNNLNANPGAYNFLFRSCSSVAARALTLSGIPAIGIHPYLLHAQMYLRSLGIRPGIILHNILTK